MQIFNRGKKYIEKGFCICYNADRQKEITSPFGRKNESPDRVAAQFGDSSCYYTGQASGRLFVALMVAVKPFDNEVANHTAHDSNEKRDYKFHSDTSSLLRVSVSNIRIILYYFLFFCLFSKNEYHYHF